MPELRNLKVPKFASYRSKTNLEAPNKGDGQSDSSHKSKVGHREIAHNTSRKSYADSFTSRIPTSNGLSSSQSHRSDKCNDIFVVDKKGDQNNLFYESLYKYSVPKYRPFGAGQVLGAPPCLRIKRESGDDKCVFLFDSGYDRNYAREKYIFSKIERQKPKMIRTCPQQQNDNHSLDQLDFISLRPARKCERVESKKQTGDNDINEYSTSNPSILTLSNLLHQPNSDNSSESELSDSSHEKYIDQNLLAREKSAKLTRQVERFPHDIEAWLSLINHQDYLIQRLHDSCRLTKAMVKSTADIKIHMYEKALKHCISLENRERLIIGLMSEGEKIWELEIQASRWEQISRNNIDSLLLWTKYLDFKQYTLSIFRFEDVKKVYLQRMKYLFEEARKNLEKSEKYYRELMYVLLRATLFIRDAGYSELAISIWQSNLEFNFCAPIQELDYKDRMTSFKDFWESEVPRIGETSAKGWRFYVNNGNIPEITDSSVDNFDGLLDRKNLFNSWVATEKLRSRSSRIPAKTLDEVVENDPFRVILYTDIQDFLFALPSESDQIHRSCINAFLFFCSLPGLNDFDEHQDDNYDDTCVIDGFLRSEFDWLKSDCSNGTEENSQCDFRDVFFAPISRFVYTSDYLFYDVTKLYGKYKPYRDRFPEDTGPVLYSFIRYSLKQLIESWPDISLTEYYLSFEYRNEPDTIKKISRALLKKNPSNFRLYHAYALIEWSRGNREVAETVFSTTLETNNSIGACAADETSILLWKSWIWICLDEKNSLKALKCLICIANGNSSLSFDISPTLLLRAKQYITSKQDMLLSSNSVFAIMYSECLAIFEYISWSPGSVPAPEPQRNIINAMKVFISMSHLLHERKQEKSHETLLQSASRLLFYHCQCGPYRPALIREYLTDFLQKFPKNTIFLSFYSWNESRLRIDNRVRNILQKSILLPENDCLTSRLFAIRHEIRTGTVHSVKAAFEHSISSPITRFSAGLWQLYILYCLLIPRLQLQAKTVWFRAIRTCPSVKELYIFGFEKFGGSLDYMELKRVWKIMEEKELRVHVNLEDEFDEIEGRRK